jgi:hypothetical protein
VHRDSNFIGPEQVNLPSFGIFNGFKGQEHCGMAVYSQFEGVYWEKLNKLLGAASSTYVKAPAKALGGS